jgi:AmpD protein
MNTPSNNPSPEWRDGWWAGARHAPSPNFGPRPAGTTVDLVVIHSIALPPGSYGGPFVHQLFTNQLDWDAHPYFQSIRGMQVSSHFFITREGAPWQFVSCNARAWHAGVSSYQQRPNCNDYSIGIELEGMDSDSFSAAQYRTLETLCGAISQHYKILAATGHEHIAPGRKTDPGPGFRWSEMRHWPTISDWLLPPDSQESDKSALPAGR